MSFSVTSHVKPFFLPHQWWLLLGNWIIPLTQGIQYKTFGLDRIMLLGLEKKIPKEGCDLAYQDPSAEPLEASQEKQSLSL